MPGLHTAPVVSDYVHGTAWRHGINHSFEVGGQLIQPIGDNTAGAVGLTRSTDIETRDTELCR